MINETASMSPKCQWKTVVMAKRLHAAVAKIAKVAIVERKALRVKAITAMRAQPTLTSHDESADPITWSSASALTKIGAQGKDLRKLLPGPLATNLLSLSRYSSHLPMTGAVCRPELCESSSTRKSAANHVGTLPDALATEPPRSKPTWSRTHCGANNKKSARSFSRLREGKARLRERRKSLKSCGQQLTLKILRSACAAILSQVSTAACWAAAGLRSNWRSIFKLPPRPPSLKPQITVIDVVRS
mmetsp:Transcript_74641/g.242521  ORF Transcript_74641/g.242521 Transcript_74641/m.242521 type:complete len:245 (-) Transcript_74641:2932-3666(-)